MSGPEAPRLRDVRGGGTMLTFTMVAVVVVAFVITMIAGSYAVAQHRARAAADQAAFSAAQAKAAGREDPCGLAGRTAVRNRARLVECAVSGDEVEFVVTVTVEVVAEGGLSGLPRSITASAHAGRVAR